jgi:hypothetical protein
MWRLHSSSSAVEDPDARDEWILLEVAAFGATSSVRQQRCEQVAEPGE